MKLRKIYLIICLIVISCFVLTCSSCKKEEEECINLMELWTNNKGLVKEHYKRANYVNPRYFPKIKLEEYYGQTLKKSLGVYLKGVLVFKTSAADSDRIFIYECYSHKDAVNAFKTIDAQYSDAYFVYKNLIVSDYYFFHILLEGGCGDEVPNMYTLSKDSKKILFCDSDVKELQIPSSIYEIMAGSFFNSSLETIVLGENVRKIGGCAFDLCKNLKKVVLNSSLESICRSAFSNCENLENIVIPKSVKYIGYVAFTQGNIFCEQTEKPKDWDSEFAVGTAKVYWAGEWEYDKDGNPRPIEKDPVTSNK